MLVFTLELFQSFFSYSVFHINFIDFLAFFSSQIEHKLLLLWSKVLELALRQRDFGGSTHDVTTLMTSFATALWTQGEDKDTSGLLGAIGLGRRSQLSLRCACDVIASNIKFLQS